MIGFAAHRLTELEVASLTSAAHRQRSSNRITQRNGYRDRDWETCAGTVALRIPQLAPRPLFSRRRTVEKAKGAVIEDAGVQGVSTPRSTSCLSGISSRRPRGVDIG
jgi:transposase-like protein